jgi:hypothetical protein
MKQNAILVEDEIRRMVWLRLPIASRGVCSSREHGRGETALRYVAAQKPSDA